MRNAKWRELFTLVSEKNIRVVRANWKFLHDPKIYEWVGLPSSHDLLEEGLRDGVWLPIYYKDIEYIEIPLKCPNPMEDPQRPLPTLTQPIVEVKELLEGLGDFSLLVNEDSLVLKGYESK